MLRDDKLSKHLKEMCEVIEQTLKNPPDLLSMHSGDNINNNRVDWDKPTQRFSSEWINWHGIQGPLSFDDESTDLEFALDSSGRLIVQNELTGKGHIDLAFGDNCLCAGTFEFNNEGFLERIRLDSGHYCPTVEHGKYLISLLLKYYNDLTSSTGQKNLEHFLTHVKVNIYNNSTKSFDVCTAEDVMTGKYLAKLRQQEIIVQQMLEKRERINLLGILVDRLLKFNQNELERLSGQKPVTGKDDHAAKKTGFESNITNLTALAASIKRSGDLNEDILKSQINQYLNDTKNACDMRSHKNIDKFVGFFTRKDVLTDTQKNYATFAKTNKRLIDELNQVPHPYQAKNYST